MDELAIVTPSRARPQNVRPMLGLIPSTIFCVQSNEVDTYRAAGAERVLDHPPLPTIGAIRQWILDNVRAECVVTVDDDLKAIRPLTGLKRKPITKSDSILQIIWNGCQICRDLGLSIFCWNRNPNPAYFSPFDPFHFNAPAAGAFGIVGRRFAFDPALNHGEDIDLTLKALRTDRVVFSDNRYYWDFGKVMAAAGGLQGVREEAAITANRERLSARWGAALDLDSRPVSARFKATTATSFRVNVPRRIPGIFGK